MDLGREICFRLCEQTEDERLYWLPFWAVFLQHNGCWEPRVMMRTGSGMPGGKGIRLCTPGRKFRGKPVKYDKQKYKRRTRIEIMFGRLKHWQGIATR